MKPVPITDIEQSQQQQESMESALMSMGDALNHASAMLDDLENDGMLGSSIRRYAFDLALVVGNVARDIDCGNDDDLDLNLDPSGTTPSIDNRNGNVQKKKWARAIIQDAQNQLALEEHRSNINNQNRSNGTIGIVPAPQHEKSAAGVIAELNENDIVDAMKTAKSILLDIEDALKNISVDDAEEIADVGLVVAKMFLWGLQNVQNQVVHTMITGNGNDVGGPMLSSSTQRRNVDSHDTLEIEIIEEEGEDDSNSNNEKAESIHTSRKSKLKDNRVRVLWPPIGPSVISVASWSKDEAVKNPILSIALALALWPTAIIVAFIGTPILTIDYALQAGYNAVEDRPLVQNLERSAANVCQVGKLYFLVSKLMLKQSVRVGKRQIERRGGIHKVAEDVGHWTVDRIMHPVESAGMAWNTLNAGVGIVVEAVSVMKDAAMGNVEHIDLNHVN